VREQGRGSRGAGEQGSKGAGEKELGSSATVSPVVPDLQALENRTSAPPHLRTSAPPHANPQPSWRKRHLSGLAASNPPTLQPSPARAKARHVPERTCAACRTKKPQGELYRIRKTPQGWTMDSSVTVGRSAYLCSSPYCHVEKRLRRTFGAQAAQISETLKTLEDKKEKLSGANIG